MKRPQTARWRSIHSATSRNFSYRTYPTYDRNTTTNLKASYFFCDQNDSSITHSSQHNGTSCKRAAEGPSFGLMLLLINRTLVYGSLTAMLVGIYFGGIVVLQRLFVILTGERSTLAVVASTLVIAALFNPLRRRIQSFIDRRFYRRKYDARKTLEAFAATLRDETDLEALSGDLVGVVRETVQPAHASLWLRPDTSAKGKPVD
jgi:hypothetical protein